MVYHCQVCDLPDCTLPKIEARQRFRLSLVLGLVILFAGLEWLVGNLSNSLALKADAWHMLTDAGTIVMALTASWLTRFVLIRRWPGRPRLTTAAAFLNGFALLLMAGLILWEAIQHLTEPPQYLSNGPMLVTASLGLVINAISIWVLHADSQNDLNIRGVFLHIVADLASSISVIVSAIAIYMFQCLWLDGAISMVIALFIGSSAVPLIRTSWQQLKVSSSYQLNESLILEIGSTSLSEVITQKTDCVAKSSSRQNK